jgi:hypothetical protein
MAVKNLLSERVRVTISLMSGTFNDGRNTNEDNS